MLDVCLPGTGGMMPLPGRHTACLTVHCEGAGILVDCGEGTQVALKKAGVNLRRIDLLLITHLHGDHIFGLPGLLMSIAATDRTDPITIAGPAPLKAALGHFLCLIAGLPFPLEMIEWTEAEVRQLQAPALQLGQMEVTPFVLKHRVTCYGYNIELPRLPEFLPQQARQLDVPVAVWKPLQHGHTVLLEDGRTIMPELVTGPPRRGLKLTYCTDSLPFPEVANFAAGADLFICEGMYGDEDKRASLYPKKHMMMQDAAELAQKAGAKRLWLTHYSPATIDPESYSDDIQAIFEQTEFGYDGKKDSLTFSS